MNYGETGAGPGLDYVVEFVDRYYQAPEVRQQLVRAQAVVRGWLARRRFARLRLMVCPPSPPPSGCAMAWCGLTARWGRRELSSLPPSSTVCPIST